MKQNKEAILNQQTLDQLAMLFPTAAVFAVDKNRHITYWSTGAEKVLGYKSSDLIGQSCLAGNRCHQCVAGCGITEQDNVNGFPIKLYHADGHIVPVKKYAMAYRDDDGQFDGGLEVLIPDDTENQYKLAENQTKQESFHGLLSVDTSMQEIFKLLTHVAKTDASVLIRGESGTGKELIARALHAESERFTKPFMAVNCAALSSSILESELFGHVKGAFTDAIRNHTGVIERADGGTLFLDEVAEIPLDLQAKLLRVIQERELIPVGSETVKKVDIRILAATHQSLRKRVKEGKFREDLMYRLRVVPLFLPPLRERKTDISLLLHHFIRDLQQRGQARIAGIAPDAMRVLLNYQWPGNVRELKNVVEYANAVSQSDVLDLNSLPPEFFDKDNTVETSDVYSVRKTEKTRIKQALLEADGNLELAAEVLGISRTTFWRKRKKYKI